MVLNYPAFLWNIVHFSKKNIDIECWFNRKTFGSRLFCLHFFLSLPFYWHRITIDSSMVTSNALLLSLEHLDTYHHGPPPHLCGQCFDMPCCAITNSLPRASLHSRPSLYSTLSLASSSFPWSADSINTASSPTIDNPPTWLVRSPVNPNQLVYLPLFNSCVATIALLAITNFSEHTISLTSLLEQTEPHTYRCGLHTHVKSKRRYCID